MATDNPDTVKQLNITNIKRKIDTQLRFTNTNADELPVLSTMATVKEFCHFSKGMHVQHTSKLSAHSARLCMQWRGVH